jgi:type II secretory pathway pseudopilin PulG
MISTRPSTRRGLTLATVLVVLGLAGFAAAILVPSLNRARETANRVKCANNLKQIGLAIQLYANDNRGAYPRTKFEPGDTLIPDVTNAGYDSSRPFGASTKVPDNCVPSALFLLLREEDITAAVFVCPSTQAQPDTFGGGANTALNRSNFSNLPQNLSYSYANPYPDNTAVAAGYKLTTRLDPGFVVVGDLNPGPAALAITLNGNAMQMRQGNSNNHRQDGENFLFADGHVEFDANPFGGLNHDNVYCRGMGGPGAAQTDLINSPKDQNDSVLLPTEAQ